MRSLFDASTQVDADEFRILANNLLHRHPYIISSMYLKRVQNSQRTMFENHMKDDGYINFSIKDKIDDKYAPSSTREIYFPVLYKEPFTPINAKQLGHDKLSDDKLKQAINRAIDTGKTATSLLLTSSDRTNAYTIFIAVYAGKTVPTTQNQRRSNISGVIALQVNATKLVPTPLHRDVVLKIKEDQNSHFTELANHQNITSISSDDWVLSLKKNYFQIETDAELYTVKIHTPIFWHEIDKTLIISAGLTGLLITLLISIQVHSIINRNNKLRRHNEEIEEIIKSRTKELALEKERAITTLESIADAVITADDQGCIDYLNPVAESLTGWSRDEAFGEPVHRVFTLQNELTGIPVNYDLVNECMTKTKIAKTTEHVAVVNRRTFNKTAVEISATPIRSAVDKTSGAVVVSHDVSDARRLAREMTHLATHDELTGLPNRILLMDRLVQAISRYPWNRKIIAVAFLDLDRFKLVNDTHGHDVGDELLRSVAKRLTSCLRKGDTVSRLSGDEFVIILRDISSMNDIEYIANKIISAFETPFQLVDEEFYSSASIGISIYPKDGESALALMKHADIAMYRAKSQGKHKYVLYSNDMGKQDPRELTLETGLRHAIEQEEFELYYQPQVDARNDMVTGVEALIRWNNPKHGLVSPLEFIPLAEKTGLIIPIGQWILKEATKQCKNWQNLGLPPIKVSVNISAVQFERGNIFNDVKAVLNNTGLAPKYLGLELTEGSLAKDPQTAINTLNKLNEIGVQLSIDDFGTGYSSLSYLKQFCVNTLKIDRCFVKDVLTDTDDAAMCAAIISIARNLKLNVIAEGVENKAQLEFLKRHDCYSIQGFYFSKPLPNDELIKYLAERSLQHKIIPFKKSS